MVVPGDKVVVAVVAVLILAVVVATVGVVGAVCVVDADDGTVGDVEVTFKGTEILEKKSSCRPKTTPEFDEGDAPWAIRGGPVARGDWASPRGEYD